MFVVPERRRTTALGYVAIVGKLAGILDVMSVVGARPQFVKLAAVSDAVEENHFRHIVVHSGQHYDPLLSKDIFNDLRLPPADFNLGVGSDRPARQIGKTLDRLDHLISQVRPSCVIVYGDTNTTLAGAIAAAGQGIPLFHVEAGLRSRNRLMPEEQNRVVTDHLSNFCLAPTHNAMENLAREGLASQSHLVGDVAVDIIRKMERKIERGEVKNPFESGADSEPYFLATLHRQENTDNPKWLRQILAEIGSLDTRTFLLVHPRLKARVKEYGINLNQGSLNPVAPLTYSQTIAAMVGSSGVITDSGGLQKEAYLLGVVCTTIRQETEWPETLESGWNVLAKLPAEIRQNSIRPKPATPQTNAFGSGEAGHKIVRKILDHLQGC